MKFAILMVLVFVTASTALATNLSCKIQPALSTPNGDVSNMVITNVEGGADDEIENGGLASDLPDQGALSAFEPGADGTISASFSNECDNMYDVILNAAALAAAIQGSLDPILGEINYDNADDVKSSSKLECQVN